MKLEHLQRGLALWRRQGVKSAMLQVPIEHASLASVAAEHGFTFHHAEGATATLKLWLQDQMEDKVPPWASHQVGGAGFVVNDARELLLVKEWRDAPDGGRVPGDTWKLPGGLIDRGESFEEGVTREVLEETGVRARFKSILAFWHRHELTWGQSDLYFVGRLEPETLELTPQPCEISDVTWMSLEEFVCTQDHPLIRTICRRLYGLDRDASGQLIVAAGDGVQHGNIPSVEMVEEPVQWPGREPFDTYFGHVRGK